MTPEQLNILLCNSTECLELAVDLINSQRALLVEARDALELCRPEHVTRGILAKLKAATGDV